MSDYNSLKMQYLNNLEHAHVAYRYLYSQIPKDNQFANGKEVVIGNFQFRKVGDAESMQIELGWAFFTRLEAVLEAFTIKLGIKEKGKSLDILDYLKRHNVTIPSDFDRGLKEYREIRNTLHHGDGDVSLLNKPAKYIKIPDGEEIHLTPDHIKNFYELLKWLGDVLSNTLV
jgi:hypothetical protein